MLLKKILMTSCGFSVGCETAFEEPCGAGEARETCSSVSSGCFTDTEVTTASVTLATWEPSSWG